MNWDIPFLEQKASITTQGAVLLGKYVVCDGFEWDREIATVTHIHSDHTVHFERCLGYYHLIFCSPETKELLITLEGEWLRSRRNLIALPYKDPYPHREERVTLYPAKHILGSAQVLVEDQDGVRLVYTGDFDFPNTKPIRTDVLVLDATFGDPTHIAKCSRDEIIDRLVSVVKEELETSSVCILGHRGKLQEVMTILTEAGITIPFLCETDIFEMCMTYQNCGLNVGTILSLKDNATQELIQKDERHITFHLLGRKLELLPPVHYTKIRVSRWGTTESFYRVADDYCIVALSDHADFNGILEYVRQCKPKVVITDNYRAGSADSLAQAIINELHIEAKAMP